MEAIYTKRYIKIQDGQIFDTSKDKEKAPVIANTRQKILREADTIEELCDGFILQDKSGSHGCKGIPCRFFDWVYVFPQAGYQDGYVAFIDGKKCQKVYISLKQLDDKLFTVYGYTSNESSICGIMLVAELTKKGEFELL